MICCISFKEYFNFDLTEDTDQGLWECCLISLPHMSFIQCCCPESDEYLASFLHCEETDLVENGGIDIKSLSKLATTVLIADVVIVDFIFCLFMILDDCIAQTMLMTVLRVLVCFISVACPNDETSCCL